MSNEHYASEFYDKAVRTAVSSTIISKKGNVCPFTIRLAWHSSGTYDKDDSSARCGGSDGATMRFQEELSDGNNAGLGIVQDILKPLKNKFPNLSYADLWTVAGVQAIELCGGPKVPFNYGRTDAPDNSTCAPNGRLPDGDKGAQHLRDIFYRMGFGDKEIVALSGAHTLGSCHRLRSGFDGPWTTNPLKFDNEYFKLLLNTEWKRKEWDGPPQFEDPSGKLMMLTTDMALIEDEKFLPYVKAYAEDQDLFFKDFSDAFSRLLALGCPAHCQPEYKPPMEEKFSKDKTFRDLCMHGSLEKVKAFEGASDLVNTKEAQSSRTALHKASFFGHTAVVEHLVSIGANVNVADDDGDTPLHDAAQLGHLATIEVLLKAGADKTIANKDGQTPLHKAQVNEKADCIAVLS